MDDAIDKVAGARLPRRDRRTRTYVAIALACLVCWSALLVNLVAFPTVDEPELVDAIYIIGPPWPERIATGVALIEAGYADTLIVSVGISGMHSADELAVCSEPAEFKVICLTPEPATTQGEASGFAHLATKNDWESAIVVTMIPHITRAGLYFERCVDDVDVLFVNDNRPIGPLRWAYNYVYQAGAWAKAALSWAC